MNIYDVAATLNQAYTLNDDGTRKSLVEVNYNSYYPVTTTTSWSYDALQRLTGETVYGSNTYVLDGNHITTQNAGYTDSYTYDLDNNRLSETHVGTLGGANDNTTYAYNGDDELTSQTDTYSASTTTTNFTYDLNGSLTTSTLGANVTSYGFDVQNRLVSFSSGSTNASYVYDDDGDRVSETVNGVTSLYLTDTNNPTGYDQPIEIKSSMNAAPSETFELGDDVLAQVDSSGNVQYLLRDGRGDVRLIVDNTQFHNVLGSFDYAAFGAVVVNSGSASTIFGQPDGPTDSASGLILNGDSTRQREAGDPDFLERDSLGFGDDSDPPTLNAEIYGDSDPVNIVDPSGHFGVPYGWLNYGSGSAGIGIDIEENEFDQLNLENLDGMNQNTAGIGPAYSGVLDDVLTQEETAGSGLIFGQQPGQDPDPGEYQVFAGLGSGLILNDESQITFNELMSAIRYLQANSGEVLAEFDPVGSNDFWNPITGESVDIIGGSGFAHPLWDAGEFLDALFRHVNNYDKTILDFSGASEEQIEAIMSGIAEDAALADALESGAIAIVGLSCL